MDSPDRLRAIAPLVLSLLSDWNFVVNESKSQLSPVSVVNYLGLTLNFATRAYRPLSVHVKSFFQFAATVSDSSPVKAKFFGYAAFLLSSTIRIYPFFPYSVVSLARLLHILWFRTRFIMHRRIPLPRPQVVASDATPTCIAFTTISTGFTFALPRLGFQTHNELYALLQAILQVSISDFVTERLRVEDIIYWLTQVFSSINRLSGERVDERRKGQVIVTDFSWAIIQSVLLVICVTTLNSYLKDTFVRLVENRSADGPIVFASSSHFIARVC